MSTLIHLDIIAKNFNTSNLSITGHSMT